MYSVLDLDKNDKNTKKAKMIQLLIHRGANINLVNYDGWTPMDEATSSKHISSIEILKSHNAQKNYFIETEYYDYISSKSKFLGYGSL